jgi:hypothetical protein
MSFVSIIAATKNDKHIVYGARGFDSAAEELAPAVLLCSPNMVMNVNVSYNLNNYLLILSILNIHMKTFQHGVERVGKRDMNLG